MCLRVSREACPYLSNIVSVRIPEADGWPRLPDAEPGQEQRQFRDHLGWQTTVYLVFRVVGVRNESTGKYHLYITNVPRETLAPEWPRGLSVGSSRECAKVSMALLGELVHEPIEGRTGDLAITQVTSGCHDGVLDSCFERLVFERVAFLFSCFVVTP